VLTDVAVAALFDVAVIVRVGPVDRAAHAMFASERVAVERATLSRRQEFHTGRALARAALADLGIDAGAIDVGKDRAPVWPAGVFGSIAHAGGLVVAVVSRAQSIGVDLESLHAAVDSIGALVLRPGEEPPSLVGVDARLVAFCAKEAVFKATFPLDRTWREFTDVEVGPQGDGGSFVVRASAHPLPGETLGTVAALGSMVVAAAWVSPAR
jgi:4'-phosphopantetheinyl transferase EntD